MWELAPKVQGAYRRGGCNHGILRYTYGNPLPRCLNQLIFLQWQFRAQPPNLIPVNISTYMVLTQLT